MEDDEKTTARTKSGEPVRTTAPAGTPVVRRSPPGQAPAVAPSGRTPSDRPLDTLTPPRTVGGRTARLRVPDDAPKPRGRAAPDPDAEPPSAPLQSVGHTVGGHTMKLATVDQIPAHEAAVVGGAALRTSPRSPQNGRAEPAPAPAPAAAPAPAPAPAAAAPARAPTGPSPSPAAAPPVTSGASADDDFSVFASPLAVSVGLVFLAMGSILTLTVGRRWVLPEPSAAASDLRSPAAAQQETATAAPKAPAATTNATTTATAIATPAAVATEPPPAATPATTKPTAQPPRGPAVAPKPTGRRPIFDLPGK